MVCISCDMLAWMRASREYVPSAIALMIALIKVCCSVAVSATALLRTMVTGAGPGTWSANVLTLIVGKASILAEAFAEAAIVFWTIDYSPRVILKTSTQVIWY